MNEIGIAEFTHANLNQTVYVQVVQLYAYYYSEAAKATLLLASGGAIIPIKESVNEVKMRVQRVQGNKTV